MATQIVEYSKTGKVACLEINDTVYFVGITPATIDDSTVICSAQIIQAVASHLCVDWHKKKWVDIQSVKSYETRIDDPLVPFRLILDEKGQVKNLFVLQDLDIPDEIWQSFAGFI